MRVVFADTGYWVALLNPRDDLHNKAVNLSKALQPAHIVTSEMVLTEVLNDFSSRGEYFRQAAANLIRSLYRHPNTTIIPQTSIQFQAALTLYEQRADKEWSQTDCVSFKIMEEQIIAEALAYDRHFVQAGYTALMRNCRV
ncbi:MAG: PIN domain-containing protein [Nostoc sp. DedQUE08]|uniref:type II toxin-antitoxin system VapC family toxin n=2 Tax=unclassified Nostoc TaxID=2593658 RepID=UPI002AD50001|nr:PIN domain-containing protein [Nostoc sp. DedQUE08]MDZ8069463.1 PIN domain-containing protein [Nostoc sp. DedQUE08]